MATSRVVRVGPLKPSLRVALEREYDAPCLEDVRDGSGVLVAVVGGSTPVGAAELDRLPDLQAIAKFGVGYDSIDVEEAARRGVGVSNTPGVLDDAVAELTVALVLDVMRRVSAADRFVRRGGWAAGESFPLAREVRGSTIGILGLGRIGRVSAERLAGLGATIVYHSRRTKEVPWTRYESPLELASASDVLVVLTPGGDRTRHLVGADVLAALGPDGFLVNVSRGSVVDEDALVSALERGVIAGAGLDVFAAEPHVPESLLRRDDVVLLPHVGSATEETRAEMARLVMENVAAVLDGRELVTPV